MIRYSSFKSFCRKGLPFVLIVGFARSQPVQKPLAAVPRFTLHDAIQAEWMRAAPNLKVDALPLRDRERYKLSLQRIGAPGSPRLLPPELETPTVEIWEAKAKEAKTPKERFTALHFLNRLKSPKALSALGGLKPDDAKTWPKHLYLEANIATARLQGGEVSEELQAFLDALQKAGKVEPVRAQAARLRLVMAGKEKGLLPLVKATPGSVLALMDAWNKGPWEKRKDHTKTLAQWSYTTEPTHPWWRTLGMQKPLSDERYEPMLQGLMQRLCEALPPNTPTGFLDDVSGVLAPHKFQQLHHVIAGIQALGRFNSPEALQELRDAMEIYTAWQEGWSGVLVTASLPTMRKLDPAEADMLRARLLNGDNPIARSAAIEDLPEAPADLNALTQLTWKDKDLEPQQTLIESYSRWKLPKENQMELLKPWLQHPDWACRYLAYQQLVKLDAAAPWPTAPEPNEREKKLLVEANRLASAGKPLRLRITFSGKRQVTLRLDPTIAPINVANLELLAKKGFFNGRRVPRVVPDFVVQMGSPYDTMDGGPGYSVRCENSLNWYGPGSVGMALSGKDTGGSQFFITTNATPHLTGKYTRMGEVENLDQALKILDDLELGAKIERVEVIE